jgi:hypothetical protein
LKKNEENRKKMVGKRVKNRHFDRLEQFLPPGGAGLLGRGVGAGGRTKSN